MAHCNLNQSPVNPHGINNTYTHNHSKSILDTARAHAKYDNDVSYIPLKHKINSNIIATNQTTHGGGFKKIQCPITNKYHRTTSKKGKEIMSTYNKHLSKNQANKQQCKTSNHGCLFNTIRNPLTNRNVSIYGNIGKKLIKSYNN
jgi:hypothetical protein